MVAALAAQLAFLLYSLFSVDAFTTRVQQIVGRDAPLGLSNGMRALLLALMVANLAAAAVAEAGAALAVRGCEKLRTALGARRAARDVSVRQSLLGPGGLAAGRLGSGISASPSPDAAGQAAAPAAAGSGIAALHVPRMQRPAGAELL